MKGNSMRDHRSATIVAMLMLAGCDIVPIDNKTMAAAASSPASPAARLRTGDPKVCVEATVEDLLRSLIRPEAGAPHRYDISFAATSLEAFDASVHKASCSTTVRIVTTDGRTLADTTLPYVVKPSSRDPEDIVVTAPTGFLKQQLTETMVADDEATRQEQQQAAEQRALLAVVKPKWLAGRWISSDQDEGACQFGPYLDFRAGHQLLGSTGRGTWQLDGVQLTYGAGAAMTDTAITNADADSFGMIHEDGQTSFMRRCPTQAPPAPTPTVSPAPMELPATFEQPS